MFSIVEVDATYHMSAHAQKTFSSRAQNMASLSPSLQMAIELQRNRELTRTLYTLRGEAPPNEHGYVRRRSKDRFLYAFCLRYFFSTCFFTLLTSLLVISLSFAQRRPLHDG